MKNSISILLSAALLALAPAAGAQTADQFFASGTNDLVITNLDAANTNFASAVSLAPSNATYNVFYAMTELLTLPDQPAGSNFLTRIGFGSAGRDVYDWTAQGPTDSNGHLVIPTTTPPLDAEEFTAQLRTNVLSTIMAVGSNLTEVTDTNFTLDLTTNETHLGEVTLDWGDVQMMEAIANTMELFIYTTHSWNLDVQLTAATNYFGKDGSFEGFLTNFPSALTVVSTADLPAAQAAFTNAINNYFAASQFIRNRAPGETYLFNLSSNEAPKEAQFRQTLTNLLASLNGPTVVFSHSPGNEVSMQAFFSGNFSPRSFLPQFEGSDFVWNSFPDLTFGGLVSGLTTSQVGKGFLKHFQSVLDVPNTSLSVLYNFTNFQNQTGVVQGPDGALYGTMATGGPFIDLDQNYYVGFGSVFKVTTNGQFSTLYSFGSIEQTNVTTHTNVNKRTGVTNVYYVTSYVQLDGAYPNTLILGSDGNLYGATQSGGDNDNGTVFKISTAGKLTSIYSFGDGNDQGGFSPAAALVEGTPGRFFGTTEFGGINNSGTIFNISSAGAIQSQSLYSDTFGAYPAAPLVVGSDGFGYGVTSSGGIVATNIVYKGSTNAFTNIVYGYGTIFKASPATGQITVLYTFGTQTDENGDPLDGVAPNALVQGTDGYLYGTTQYGGANDDYIGYNGFYSGYGSGDGTLFRISHSGAFSTLLSFDKNSFDGYNPIGSLLAGPGGAYYGVASAGGANKAGAVFIFNPSGTATNLVWLTKSSGGYGGNLQAFAGLESFEFGPYSPIPLPSFLTPGLDGNFYGTTTDSGNNGSGTVYKLVTSAQTVVQPPQIQVWNGTNAISNGQTNAVDFGSVLQNQPGPTMTFTVTNAGGLPLILAAPIVPLGFTLTTNPPSAIAGGSSATFSVQLDTTTVGLFSNNISIANNDTSHDNDPFVFPVMGQVNGAVISLSGNLAFGGVAIGSNAPGTLTISNGGNLALLVSNISYPPGYSGVFSNTIAANGSTNVIVTFSPTTATNYDGTVRVQSDATGGAGAISISGYGASGTLVLTILTNGNGKVLPNLNGKSFNQGTKHTITAVAGTGFMFSNWSGSINTNKNPLTFAVEPGTLLEANFVTNPFLAAKGTYNGLFFETNGVTEQTAGMLKGLALTQKGTFSATLLISGGSHLITGSFDVAGQASNVVKRATSQGGNLLLEMTLVSPSNAAPQVIGSVSGTNNGVPWTATNLMADLATNTLPSAEFTMLMPPDTNNEPANLPPGTSPGGDGYALITNYAGTAKNPAAATARITGALADGTAFNQTVPVSQTGFVPIYANLYNGKGLLLGWINLDLTNTEAVADTGLTWIHPARSTGLYQKGFTNVLCTNQIKLSSWTDSAATFALLTNLSILDTCDDTNALANYSVDITAAGKLTGTSVKGSINLKTGLLTVTLGSGGHQTNAYGAILLNETNARGYMLTKTNGEAINLGH